MYYVLLIISPYARLKVAPHGLNLKIQICPVQRREDISHVLTSVPLRWFISLKSLLLHLHHQCSSQATVSWGTSIRSDTPAEMLTQLLPELPGLWQNWKPEPQAPCRDRESKAANTLCRRSSQAWDHASKLPPVHLTKEVAFVFIFQDRQSITYMWQK